MKEATYANYGHFARKHICPALGRLKLKNLTPAHVRSFYWVQYAPVSPQPQ